VIGRTWLALLAAAPIGTLSAQVERHLEPCTIEGATGPIRCGSISVPETDAPGSRTIRLKVVYLGAFGESGTHAPVAFLAGGPGQAATSLATSFEERDGLRATYDILLFDQRGTGDSNPLGCDNPLEGGPAQQFQTLLPVAFVRECARRLSPRADLAAYGTAEAAQDVVSVLDSLDIPTINLLAGSYGTRLAVTAARLAPSRIRSMVLIGFAPPTLRIPETAAEDVDAALARLDPTVLVAAKAVAARLDTTPVTVDIPAAGDSLRVTVGRGAFAYALRGMLYGPMAAGVPALLRGADAPQGFEPIATYYLQRSGWARSVGFPLGMYLSIICAEDVGNIDPGAAARAARETVMRDWMLISYAGACAEWPVPPRVVAAVEAPVTTPTLVLSGAHDPVTPPRYAREAMAWLPNGHLMLFADGGHGVPPGCGGTLVPDFFGDPTTAPAPPEGCAVEAAAAAAGAAEAGGGSRR